MNHLNTNLSNYAKSVLDTFSSPVASSDRVDAMLYMTVGAERMRLLHNLANSLRRELSIGQPNISRHMYAIALLGVYGSGKSHIGYLLKHDALTCGEELIVAHLQISGEPHFSHILAGWLRNLRLAGIPSLNSNGVEISAFRRLVEWTGDDRWLNDIIRGNTGNLHPAMANDLFQALRLLRSQIPRHELLQQFIDNWVQRNEPRAALEVFESILRMFCFLKANRLLLVLDEFEQISARSEQEQRETLQHIQDLHDDFAARDPNLPSTYMVLLSTPDWWRDAGILLPSLCGHGQRVRRSAEIPQIERVDVSALLYRYLGLYQLAYDNVRPLGTGDLEQLAETIWREVAAYANQIRMIHIIVRRNLEAALGVTPVQAEF